MKFEISKKSTTVKHLRHLNQNISVSHNSYQTKSGWMALDGFDIATPAAPGLFRCYFYHQSSTIWNPKTLHTSLTFPPNIANTIQLYYILLPNIIGTFHQNPRWRFSPSSPFARFEGAKWQCPQSRNKPLVADVVTCRQKGHRVAPGWRFWCWCSHSRQSTWPHGTNATTGPCSYTRWKGRYGCTPTAWNSPWISWDALVNCGISFFNGRSRKNGNSTSPNKSLNHLWCRSWIERISSKNHFQPSQEPPQSLQSVPDKWDTLRSCHLLSRDFFQACCKVKE